MTWFHPNSEWPLNYSRPHFCQIYTRFCSFVSTPVSVMSRTYIYFLFLIMIHDVPLNHLIANYLYTYAYPSTYLVIPTCKRFTPSQLQAFAKKRLHKPISSQQNAFTTLRLRNSTPSQFYTFSTLRLRNSTPSQWNAFATKHLRNNTPSEQNAFATKRLCNEMPSQRNAFATKRLRNETPSQL